MKKGKKVKRKYIPFKDKFLYFCVNDFHFVFVNSNIHRTQTESRKE